MNQIEQNVGSNCPLSIIPDLLPPTDSLVSSDADSSATDLQATVSPSNPYISPATLLPFPKAAPQKTSRPFRLGKTRILTNTLEKIALEEKEKQHRKQKRSASALIGQRRSKQILELKSAEAVAAAIMQNTVDDDNLDSD